MKINRVKTQSIPVGDSFANLDVPLHGVLVRAKPDRHSGSADLVVRVSGRESVLTQFADACALDLGRSQEKATPAIGADFRFVAFHGGLLLVLGVRQVVALNPADGTIKPVLERFRQASDDHGFYREEVLELPDGVVLIYEGGVARISNNGDAQWHRPLTWNDVLARVDNEAIHFAREEPNGSLREWSTDLRDGSER